MSCKTANVSDFHDEMGDNPLGDRIESKAIGPYVVELYERPIFTRKRERDGESVQGVVNVWEKAGPDHRRGYRDLGSFWFDEPRARAEYAGIRSAEGVESFVEMHEE